MRIENLKLFNVRNHKFSSFEFSEEVIIAGDNGSGKTTVLESIYFLLAMRGFKKQPVANAISFGEKFLRIESDIYRHNFVSKNVLKHDDKKSISVDENVVENISEYLFDNPVAVYSPDFLGILSLSHSDRRSFIDRYLYYTDRPYIDLLRQYNRNVSQKNSELARENIDKTYIDILNESIIKLSKEISEKRIKIIGSVNENLKKIYAEISLKDEVYLSYSTNINKKEILEKENINKRVVYGIQRDRIDMTFNGKLIEKFSSFGQKKTFILLCLLSVLKYVEEIREIDIITLLDDFEAGLDIRRAGILKGLFSDKRQVLYTGVDGTRLDYNKIIKL